MAEIMNTPLPPSGSQADTPTDGTEQKQRAQDRLAKALGAVKSEGEKAMLTPIADHLKKRIQEDAGFAEDVLQEHKTLDRMMKYIRDKARKYASGSCVAVPDTTVYEWAEDYIRLDDKALAEKERQEAEKREAEQAKKREQAKKSAQKITNNKKPPLDIGKPEKTGTKEKKQGKNQIEGQMSLFDMLGA